MCILTFLWGRRSEDNFNQRPIGGAFALPTTIWTLFTSLFILLILAAQSALQIAENVFAPKQWVICNRDYPERLDNWKKITLPSREKRAVQRLKHVRLKRGPFHNFGFHKLVILTFWKKSILSRRQRRKCLTTYSSPVQMMSLHTWISSNS